jgi:hypothetical protein
MYPILLIIFITLPKISLSQYTVIDTTYNATLLAQQIAGHGVLISNAVYSGSGSAKARISCTNCAMPVTDGIMLSTGRCSDLNDIPSILSTEEFQLPGDTALSTYFNTPISSIYDAVKLEFDMTVLSDSFEISYSYLSEEYNEYTNTACFDGFLILVDGINIAYIPNTTLPVNVNYINNGPAPFGFASNGPCLNCNYYVDNVNGTNMVYDGYTTLIKNKISINPFISHHIKIVLADFGDGQYSSAIMIKSFSAKSSSVNNPCYLFSVNALPKDSMLCQGSIQLDANSSYPSSSYEWFPNTGLSNSNIKNPVASQIFDQTYTVVATHQNPNCIATDSIHISAAKDINTNFTTCNDTIALSLPINSNNYNWISFTDTNNISTALLDTSIIINVSQPGVYTGTSTYQSCTINNTYIIIDTCIVATKTWPGDCNNDLSVDVLDLLYLARGFAFSGPSRPDTTNIWDGYWGNNWNQSFFNGINYKNADCNGDGIINASDTNAIQMNYGQTHTNRQNNSNIKNSPNQVYIVAHQDTVLGNEWMYFDIMAGTTSNPIDSLLGISFTLNFNSQFIITPNLYFSSFSTQLGTPQFDLVEMIHNNSMNGNYSIGISRINQSGILNFVGKIGTIGIQASASVTNPSNFILTPTDITIMKESGQTFSASSIIDSTLILPSIVGISTFDPGTLIKLYPNPSTDFINIETTLTNITSIKILDVAGREISNLPSIDINATHRIFTYDINNLPQGMYTIIFTSQVNIIRKQFFKY